MKEFGSLIYSPEKASGEAISKVETHTPKIELPSEVRVGEPFEVKIKIGPHPNKVEHSIRRIEVYFYEEGRAFNPIHIASFNFEPGYIEPELTIKLKLEKNGILYVIGYCNLHGLWEARREIKLAK